MAEILWDRILNTGISRRSLLKGGLGGLSACFLTGCSPLDFFRQQGGDIDTPVNIPAVAKPLTGIERLGERFGLKIVYKDGSPPLSEKEAKVIDDTLESMVDLLFLMPGGIEIAKEETNYSKETGKILVQPKTATSGYGLSLTYPPNFDINNRVYFKGDFFSGIGQLSLNYVSDSLNLTSLEEKELERRHPILFTFANLMRQSDRYRWTEILKTRFQNPTTRETFLGLFAYYLEGHTPGALSPRDHAYFSNLRRCLGDRSVQCIQNMADYWIN